MGPDGFEEIGREVPTRFGWCLDEAWRGTDKVRMAPGGFEEIRREVPTRFKWCPDEACFILAMEAPGT